MELYERIRTLSESRGISIQRLEKECGLSPSTINKWSKNSPSIDKVLKVAKYFEVSLDSIAESETANKKKLTEDETELLNYYRKAPNPAKKATKAMLKEFSEETE